jgi:hypothetical protein
VGNYRISRWAKVIDAWLKLLCVHETMADGAVTITIKDATTVWMTVEAGVGHCFEHEGAADVQASPGQVLRLLFGPGSPALTMSLSGNSSILQAWCPLPMSLPRQDHV